MKKKGGKSNQSHDAVVAPPDLLKADFIADAIHELRTPLAIIRGNIDLGLRDKALTSESRQTFEAINTEAKYLSLLLTDLTLLTLHADKIKKDDKEWKIEKIIPHKKIHLFEVIKNVVERTRTLAKEKGIKIRLKRTFPQIKISGNKIYLEKLFINIINNAIVYGKKNGEIVIDSFKVGNMMNITIQDNGMGISKKDLPFVFQRFYRVDKKNVGDHGGTGLGLSIAKWIVEEHRGVISASSIKGKSTIFTISLPMVG